MSNIKMILSECIRLTENELQELDRYEEDYINSLEKLVHVVESASPEQIQAEHLDSELEQSLILDQKLFPLYCKTLAERVSLMATLAAYRLSIQKGLPKHSPVYMGWVAKLKKRIEARYGTEVKNYS